MKIVYDQNKSKSSKKRTSFAKSTLFALAEKDFNKWRL